MKFSLNNRLILEPYVKEALKAEIKGGIATPGQRDNVKGLKLILPALITFPNGDKEEVPAGSIAYIREETLHTHAWASKPFNCNGVEGKFLIVDLTHIEFLDILEE